MPNNHLFYTLLLWAWHAVVGDDPLRLRLLGLLLTLGALPALFIAGRAIAGARAGALAALVLGSSQVAGNFASYSNTDTEDEGASNFVGTSTTLSAYRTSGFKDWSTVTGATGSSASTVASN